MLNNGFFNEIKRLDNEQEELKKKLELLSQQKYKAMYDALENLEEEKKHDLNDAEAYVCDLNKELEELKKNGLYDQMANVARDMQKQSDVVNMLHKEYDEVKALYDYAKLYYDRILEFNGEELQSIQNSIMSFVSKSQFDYKIYEYEYYRDLAKITGDSRYYEIAKNVLEENNEFKANENLKLADDISDDGSLKLDNDNDVSNDADDEKMHEITELMEKAKEENNIDYLVEARKIVNELSSNDKDKLFMAIDLLEKICQTKNLVSLAVETEKAKDYNKALKAVDKLSNGETKNELLNKLDSLVETNNDKFISLVEESHEVISKNKELEENDVKELADRYTYIDNETKEKYKEKYNVVITCYNNKIQDDYQKSLTKADFKKYGIFTRFTELFGWMVRPITRTKVYKKVLDIFKRKRDEALDVKDHEMIDKYDKKVEKMEKRISDGDVVGGVRLFMARNKLAKIKAKLYHGYDVSFAEPTDTISMCLSSGINKVLEDETISKDKSRVIIVLDQYMDLLASGNNDDVFYDEAYKYLESVSNVLSESEYFAYFNKFQMIENYRNANKGIPYHLDSNNYGSEIDEMVKYYDNACDENLGYFDYVKSKRK